MLLHYTTTLPYSTLLYFTLLYPTLLYSTLLYFTLPYFTRLYFTLLYPTLLDFTLLYFTLLYPTLLCPTLLDSTLLYSTLLSRVRVEGHLEALPANPWAPSDDSSLYYFTDFYRFFGLSWETSTFNNCHSEGSRDSGSRRTEFSLKSTTSLH